MDRSQRTQERILEGALQAVARRGIKKLSMSDVSECSGLSRATLYLHFPTREDLLRKVAEREGLRFRAELLEAIADAPPGELQVGIALRYAAEHAREHPALQRLLEAEPAFVLNALQERFPTIRATLLELLAPGLAETHVVKQGIATAEQLVDWMTRIMISAFLFPDDQPEKMADGLTGVYRNLVAGESSATKTPKTKSRKKTTRKKR